MMQKVLSKEMALLSLLSTHSHDRGWSSERIIIVIIDIGDA